MQLAGLGVPSSTIKEVAFLGKALSYFYFSEKALIDQLNLGTSSRNYQYDFSVKVCQLCEVTIFF